MSNKKEKVIKTKVKDAKFIRFSPVQQGFIIEVRNRVQKDLNGALRKVYEELGILEKIDNSPPEMYQPRMHDCSGIDVLPPPLPLQDSPSDPPQPDPPEKPPVEEPKDIKPPEKKPDN